MSTLNNDDLLYSNISLTSGSGAYTIGSGGPYTIASGANGTNYAWNTSASSIDWSVSSSMTSNSGKLTLQGDQADIEVNGRSLMGAIEALEQRLNIMVPNPKLEAEWDELRELGDRYRALEKQCKEKGQMWAQLRKVNKSSTQG